MLLTDNRIIPTPENFAQAERGLLTQTNGESVLWAGRAATALYYAYQVAKARQPHITQPDVIVPAMMCATAANTAHIAGLTPRFADVDPATGLITLGHIQARHTANTVAVVVIHLLGQLVDIAPIRQWCDQHDIILIEDPTQALGATYTNGSYAGSVGDYALFSFGSSKFLKTGGGVLISNTAEAHATLQAVLSPENLAFSEPDRDTVLALGLSYRNLHHALVGLLRLRSQPVETVSQSFMAIRPAYETLYLRNANPAWQVNEAWHNLEANLAHRRQLADLYTEGLQDGAWRLLTGYQQSGVCWRYSLLLNNPDKQVVFSEAVRRDGFHVSNLYWAVNQFFNPVDDCPNADDFGRRIVNLWVDEIVDADTVRGCIASLQRHEAILNR